VVENYKKEGLNLVKIKMRFAKKFLNSLILCQATGAYNG